MTENSNGHQGPAMDQAVADCFGALLAAISTSADEWRIRAAEALMDCDDGQAQKCFAAVRPITDAASEVETLYGKWRNKWPSLVLTPPAAANRNHAIKQHGSKLRVHLNGTLVEYPNAAETFARTIERIGIERVARLGKVLSGIALIGTSKTTSYQGQFVIGEFYICTHSNTQVKKRLLDEIAAELARCLTSCGGYPRDVGSAVLSSRQEG